MVSRIVIGFPNTSSLLMLITLTASAGELHQHIQVKMVDQRLQANFCRPEKG